MKICVIGGGASGLFAAYGAAINGNEVTLFEKNEKIGKKLYITGKGRCNLTNDVSTTEFMSSVVCNNKFLYSALNHFSPQDTIDFFTTHGLKLKTERGKRVFPYSDKSSDVIKILEKLLIAVGVDIRLNTKVLDISIEDNIINGVFLESGLVSFDKVIICTGGLSYPLTGSTGDGYKFAKKAGHSIVELKPSLVGIELFDDDFISLQGLSLKNVRVNILEENKVFYTDFGEMIFTHFGVSGPIILSSSCFINKKTCNNLSISIDLKPAISYDELDVRLIKELSENNKKSIVNMMANLVPKSLIPVILNRANIDFNKICCNISKKERTSLGKILKNFVFKIKGLRPVEEAIVTSGGVSVKEINPTTMESKLVKGLFFAGEVLDVDAFTGGFNLQIAFSTGYLSGQRI